MGKAVWKKKNKAESSQDAILKLLVECLKEQAICSSFSSSPCSLLQAAASLEGRNVSSSDLCAIFSAAAFSRTFAPDWEIKQTCSYELCRRSLQAAGSGSLLHS